MEGELNVINIMNDLRNLKIIIKNTFMTKEVKRKIKLTGKNVIDLDTSSDESSDKNDSRFDTGADQQIKPYNRVGQIEPK